MSLEVGESEKCYRFLDGVVHCWLGPITAFLPVSFSAVPFLLV